MSVSITEVDGFYVASSLPKVLMPICPKHQKLSKQGKIREGGSHSCFGNVLYTKSRNSYSARKKSGRNEKLFKGSHGDAECPPVPGREHMTVQTDLYLEELCDVIDEIDEQCQTDSLLDRPASPLFVPAKIGVDVETQILPGELFDFDFEVQPLLEALIGQTLEQSLIEIIAEEELAALKDQQQEYESRRNSELAERQRLEEQERRLMEERQRRLQEQEEAVKLQEETAEKIAACVFAQNYLSDLLPKVYQRLETQGYFVTQVPETQEIEENFWPWLMEEVDSEVTKLEASCSILDSMIKDTVQYITQTTVIRPVTPNEYPQKEENEVVQSETEVGELEEEFSVTESND